MTTVGATGTTTGTTTGPTAGPIGTLGTNAATGTNAGSATTQAGSSTLDQDAFLKLLVAQLKYQDPSSPSDPTQFMAETAQFSVVQKLDALSTLDQKVLDATHAQTATALIGRTVTYTDYSGTSRTGTVSGTTYGSQNPTLTVDGVQVALDAVTAVGTTGSATPKTTG